MILDLEAINFLIYSVHSMTRVTVSKGPHLHYRCNTKVAELVTMSKKSFAICGPKIFFGNYLIGGICKKSFKRCKW